MYCYLLLCLELSIILIGFFILRTFSFLYYFRAEFNYRNLLYYVLLTIWNGYFAYFPAFLEFQLRSANTGWLTYEVNWLYAAAGNY